MTGALRELRAILTPRALAAWAGTDRLSALPFQLPSGAATTSAGKLFALLVAGDEVELDERTRDAFAICRALRDAELVDVVGTRARARASILPLGPSLLVCDRLDADRGLDVVCWPDDSSYHLALAIPPGRRERWLDIACGSAFAPLLRPELAEHAVATDLDPHAVEMARRGIALSGRSHRVTVEQRDLAGGLSGPFQLVTCNAPIPADVGPRWRATADASLFARLFADVPRVLAPGGLVVVHAALDHVAPIVADLPGERIVVSYVPEGGRQFGIVWWQPDGAPRHAIGRRVLTPDRPHLSYEDRDRIC